jgi:hypothetical protein
LATRGFERELGRQEAVRQRFRIDQLARIVGDRPLAVAQCTRGRFGDRLTLWLDGGSRLRLRLFWPCPDALAALTGIAWNDEIGWAVAGRKCDGRPIVLYAWDVKVG